MYAHSLSSYYYYRTVMYKLCAYAFKYLLLSWIRFPVAALVFFFLFQLAYYCWWNGMKDLWCSSTVWLLSTQI